MNVGNLKTYHMSINSPTWRAHILFLITKCTYFNVLSSNIKIFCENLILPLVLANKVTLKYNDQQRWGFIRIS